MRPGAARVLWLYVACLLCAGWIVSAPVQAAVSHEPMVVQVKLNTENKGDLFIERTRDNDFLIRRSDLITIGFSDPEGAVLVLGGERYVSLRSLGRVSFTFDERRLELSITASPQVLTTQTIAVDQGKKHASDALPNRPSLFFNYALTSTNVGFTSPRPGFAGELGWRVGNLLLLTESGTVPEEGTGHRRQVRLMSSITHDDRGSLRRTVLGDFVTPIRELSSSLNLGGLSISKLYALNPYFVPFPMQSVTGNVALPSELEVYIDGQRVRTDRLKPGEFELRDILGYGGARNVQLLLRDPFGRVQHLTYSFYFSDQALRRGLHEYSYNIGAVRRRYGAESNAYGPVMASMFHRYGLTNAITLGWRAEGTRQLLNTGPLATVVMGDAGVASMALARSSIAGQNGWTASASYTYQASNWSLGGSVRRDWGWYASLGDPVTVSNRHVEGNVSVSSRLGSHGSISLSHSFFSGRSGFGASGPTIERPFATVFLEDRRATTLGYSVPLIPGRAALVASLTHLKDRHSGSRNEFYVGLNIFLDRNYSASASYRRSANTDSESVHLVKQQPRGEGLGFVLAADRWAQGGEDAVRMKSTAQYNAPAAIIRAELGRERDQRGRTFDDYRVSLAGGAGYVGGELGFGRPITGSFAIVKVATLPGVGVSLNNQRMGQTDGDGKVLVPELTAYADNEISLAAESMPIEYSVPSVTRRVAPPLRGGAVIDFAVIKLQAFIGRLNIEQMNKVAPLEFAELTIGTGSKSQRLLTARRGEFYIENLAPGNYEGKADVAGRSCLFDLILPVSAEIFVDIGEFTCRMAP